MQRSLLIGLSQSLVMGSVGLIAGGVAGWIGLLLAHGSLAVAAIIARVYLALAVVLPATLLQLNFRPQETTSYSKLSSALLLMLVASAVGSAVASVSFLTTAVNVPGVYSNENNMEIALALKQELGWDDLGIVWGVTTISSLFIAVWQYQQTRHQTVNNLAKSNNVSSEEK